MNLNDHQVFKDAGLDIYRGQFYTFEVYESGLKMISDITNKIIQIDNLWVQFKRYFNIKDDKNF